LITFNNICEDKPYQILREKYDEALSANQKNIEAIAISSYSNESKEVNSRFVNLKFVNNKDFIFFSNYNSPKSQEFISHNQITALIFWSSIDFQIRIKANIKKTSQEFNTSYFASRDNHKNALAISSEQSNKIASYNDVKKKHLEALNFKDLDICPSYWGGFTFTPYYFEFWKGHKSRLNQRAVYEKEKDSWNHFILQP
tara:strand:- start:2709 stop:3305 length:597 start_codon:yes stop_codon:yes gene_type:complete